MSLFAYDASLRTGGRRLLCGVDEAGRGPLAGPVYAAAVILPQEEAEGLELLNDSKKLTEKRREALYQTITQIAPAWYVASASPAEIDGLNILQATMLAMRRAVAGLILRPDLVLVDGNQDPKAGIATRTVVKGDGLSACIAAASVLAKVTRDRRMGELDAEYPGYGFAKHKGYPTALHYRMLEAHGPCPEHRTSFLRKWREAHGVT